MKNGLLKIGVVFTAIFSSAIAAYGDDDAYSYEAILQKYKDVACNAGLKPIGVLSKKTCVIENPLSLKKAIAVGLKNNPEVLMAYARIKRASAMLKRAKSAFYPYVGIYSEYVQGDAPSAFLFKSIDQRKMPAGTDFNHPGWFENFEAGVKAGVNLYNGGKDLLGHDMAKLDLELSRLDHKGINNRITEMVIRAFYDALAGKNFIAVATESVETVRSQVRIMEVRFKFGGALKTDILSLKVRVAASEEALVRSKNQYLIALAALAEILGLEPDIDLNLRENMQAAVAIIEDVVAATKSAVKNRPELKSIRQKLRQSEMAAGRVRAGYLPRIDLMTHYYHDDPDMQYSADRENWTAGIYASWDLFTGFSTKNEEKSAVANVHELLAKDRQVLLAIKFDVKKAYLNYHEAKERLKVAQSGVHTAKETLRLVKKQYEGGSANITRYLEAELDYTRGRNRKTAAFFDREKAMADIARATGQWAVSIDSTSLTETK